MKDKAKVLPSHRKQVGITTEALSVTSLKQFKLVTEAFRNFYTFYSSAE